jgi:phosphatidylinositol alpha-1,6-mannosyltransferase
LEYCKILIVTTEFPPGPGGIGHHAWFLAKELTKRESIHIEVLCPKDYALDSEVLKFDEESPFKIHRFRRVKGLTYVLRIIKLGKLLLGNSYTHFIASGKFALWMIWIQKLLGKKSKTLCILHGSEVNLSNNLLRAITHTSISKFNTIISVSTFTQSLLPQSILDNAGRLRVIPNGLDKSDFIFKNNIELKGLPALLTVGHVSPRKGQHRLIKALPLLIEKFPQIHYHIVGRAINQGVLETLSKKLCVESHITFHGSVKRHEDLWDFYRAADIFVLLSENQPNGDVEGFGIVALEANACGIPVLGAKYCGVEEAVKSKESGYLVDGDSVDEIFEGIQFCLDNKVLLKVKTVEWSEKHAWSEVSKDFEACL